MISQRLHVISPSPTLALNARAAELKRQGHDIINLCAGEPDFATPPHVCEAAQKAMDAGWTKYTPIEGFLSLRQAIAKKFSTENGLEYNLDQITVGNGGKQVIFNALFASLNPGDEVLIPCPYWVSYPDMVRLCQGEPVFIPASLDFKITASHLEAAITPKTRWFILNSPSNPTGAVYTREELLDLADVLMRHPDVWILSDDIYESLVYEGVFTNIVQAEPRLKMRTLIVNGVSKSHAMTGWRLGYGVGPKALIQAINTVQSQTTSNASSISQAAAIEALTGPQDFLDSWRDIFKRRRDLACGILEKSPKLSVLKPAGAFYLYVGCQKLLGEALVTDADVSEYLLNEARVAVVPGSAFGLSPYIRLSYALGDTDLENACDRIVSASEKR